MRGKRVVFFMLVLVLLMGQLSSECVYDDNRTTNDLMRLEHFKVKSTNPTYMYDDVWVELVIRNVDKLSKNLGSTGIFIEGEDPDGDKRVLTKRYAYDIIQPLETKTIETNIHFNKVGKWIIWPSYHLIINGDDKFGDDYWAPCTVYVERRCKIGDCMTKKEAEDTYGDYIVIDDDPCGYVYYDDIIEDEKYCIADDTDTDSDKIPDVFDECINEMETYNGFMDEDGCPDVVPKECPSGMSCIDEEHASSNYILYKDENGDAVICGYADPKAPQFCYISKASLPDLVVESISYNPMARQLRICVKNVGHDTDIATILNITIGSNTSTVNTSFYGRREVCVDIKYTCSGNFTTIANIDPSDDVMEQNEYNNIKIEQLGCPTKPDLVVESFNIEHIKDNAYKIKITVKNKGLGPSNESKTRIIINNETFFDAATPEIDVDDTFTLDIPKVFTASCPLNIFTINIDADDTNDELDETNNNATFSKVINITCPSTCVCVGGTLDRLLEKGYVPCVECMGNVLKCGQTVSNMISALVVNTIYCMKTKIFDKLPCPPSDKHFGYYNERTFSVVFSKWDDMEIGDVIGDEMDEVVIARDDNNGELYIYDGEGNLIMKSPIRYTKYDRMTLIDVDGDGKKEVITAVDEDAEGDYGMFYIYKVNGRNLTEIKRFKEYFHHYDEVFAGDVLNYGRDQLIVFSRHTGKLIIFVINETSNGFIIAPEKAIPVPFDKAEFRYTAKGDGKPHHGIKAGNFVEGGSDEIIFFNNKNSMEESSVSIYRVVGENNSLELIRTVQFPYTKYDAVGVGDVLGDDLDEFFVAIDEARAVFIGDAKRGLIKTHYRRYTKYDEIGAGNFITAGKKEIAIVIDEDNMAYFTYEDDLMEGEQ